MKRAADASLPSPLRVTTQLASDTSEGYRPPLAARRRVGGQDATLSVWVAEQHEELYGSNSLG